MMCRAENGRIYKKIMISGSVERLDGIWPELGKHRQMMWIPYLIQFMGVGRFVSLGHPRPFAVPGTQRDLVVSSEAGR